MAAKLDRLSRSVHDATGLMQRAEREGWALVALDASIDTATPQGKALMHLLATFAELERGLIGQRTKDALAVRRAQGVRLGRPRVLDEQVARRIRDARVAGRTWTGIADDLNEQGVPTATGRKWFPATVRAVGLRDEHGGAS